MMREPGPDLAAFAVRLDEARLPGFVDLYLARTGEAWWQVEKGRVVEHRTLLREGAAARSTGSLRSADGLDRLVLAALLGVPARTLPNVSLAPFPTPPDPAAIVATLGAASVTLHWRGTWSAVIGAGRAQVLQRPDLLEVATADGQRLLATWPLPEELLPPPLPRHATTAARPGRATVLFQPAAAAVLVHELIGHPLEGDVLLRGASPWVGRRGERLFRVPLDVADDPTLAGLPGSFSADDEGMPAARRALVRAGVLVGAICDRSSAAPLGAQPGCARRASIHTPPRPRISNLVVGAGGEEEETSRREARIEVASLTSGTVEPSLGLLMLSVRSAFSLRRGRREHALAPFTLVGGLPSVCEGVLATVGPAVATAAPGWCNKAGDVVATAAVTPALLLAGLEVR